MSPMGETRTIDGAGLLGWARRSVAALRRRREEINELNVFPVPDSDTGSNMAATMGAALAAAEDAAAAAGGDAAAATREIGAALANGAVHGARGNSGTVLSQVLRAIAEAARAGRIDGADVRRALAQAVDLVDRAIADPVEGTILTVLREAAAAAGATGSADARAVVEAAAEASRVALAQTPSQLAVLREAGVVDAGGAGLVLLLDALADELGAAVPAAPALRVGHAGHGGRPGPAPRGARPDPGGHGLAGGRLEVMFHLPGDPGTEDLLRERLAGLGDSLVLAGDAEGGTMVHIHTADAGAVLEAALELGRPGAIRIEILDEAAVPDAPSRVVLALVAPGPLAELMGSSGARPVHPGADPVAAVREAIAGCGPEVEIVLLPNGLVGNRGLVEIELAAHSGGRTLAIISAPTPANGLAALAVHDPELPLAVDAYAMGEAAAGVRTAELTRAAGPGLTAAGPCAAGDVLAEVGGDILVVAPDLATALPRTVDLMLRSGGELVTLLLGDGAAAELAAALRAHLGRSAPGVDVAAYAAEGIGSLILLGVE